MASIFDDATPAEAVSPPVAPGMSSSKRRTLAVTASSVRSIPAAARSTYASSTDTCCTTGDSSCSSPITASLERLYAPKRGDRNAVPAGHNRRAWAVGIADRAP